MDIVRNVGVFVSSISKKNGIVVVEAANVSEEGPPFVRFETGTSAPSDCHIGKRYFMTISEDPLNL